MELKDPNRPSDYGDRQHKSALFYMSGVAAFMTLFVGILAADGQFSWLLSLLTAGCVGNVVYGYITVRQRRP
ncbi:hypothetical protein [Streptomyces sp. SGAir0957]